MYPSKDSQAIVTDGYEAATRLPLPPIELVFEHAQWFRLDRENLQ